ncbi:glutamine-hydrolyzing GMP synthase [Salinilacustrithrix flava]|uniref:glutamine-hydrolyzing GMP synthase n=1 Tax=Salinilacustrithrix flava TaxID=2957203 RepID=UPI003D7C2FDA
MTTPSIGTEFDTVLVVDFGAQYAQLIARRVREAHVHSEIVPHDITAAEIRERAPQGIIFSGGPASVHADGAPTIDQEIYDTGVPILGICYGGQLVARDLGGEVAKTGRGEYGRADLERADLGTDGRSLLFGDDAPDSQVVWMSHFDTITRAPEGFQVVASTPDTPAAAFESPERGLYGVQFHPEVVHTQMGQDLLKHFLYDACGCRPSWTMLSVIETQVEAIRAQVGDGRAICGLSGGVDSAVAAALVHKAIGHQLTCVFVDTGLMRKDEGDQVVETFKRNFGIELIHVRAADRFFDKLAGVTDPEDKRKAIGELFIRIFEDAKGGITDADFLVQGTLYPDVIESGGGAKAATIKSHHNVGGLPEDMDFDLVEPLRDLFKDEVRRVGEELGLPEEIVWRQPFPGPGLGVRIIGEVTPDKVALLQEADAIVRVELHKAGMDREIWQAFAVLPDIKAVGVMGDERTYGYPCIIRAVTSDDAMTADWARLPYDLLEKMSSRIINEVPGINRVAYDITSKPPGTIEWE